MVTAVVILTLLTVAASLASWLFGQWLARRTRISATALAIGGGGTMLLIGAVAFVTIGATTSWQRFMPVPAAPPLIAPTLASSRPPDPAAERAAKLRATERSLENRAETLATARWHLERSEYSEAAEIARQYLAEHPGDADLSSVLARARFAAEHPGPASVAPAAFLTQWQATDCVASTRSDEGRLWLLENGCGRVVAVLFASCPLQRDRALRDCFGEPWSYEPAGILMTPANDKPMAVRLGKGGPLVAPIFTIRDAAGTGRQIGYLACEVTAPGVLEVLHDPRGELTEQRLTAELRADACYGRVLDWARSGQLHDRSPDSLLRTGID
ncbi:MAG TPA: hypothetical protein VH814_03045 [Steroidobacteraceae bacterium]|jgi:hypothetical protein